MTRVIAGSAGGRRLAVPPGTGTRPTSDRAREGLFSTWQALLGTLDGIRIADLYAGSGAVGLEALSAARSTPCSSRPTRRPSAPSGTTSGPWACRAPRSGPAKRSRS